MTENLVCFAHGKESGPWGTKITHLADVARRNAFEVISPDYSHTPDPRIRVRQLITHLADVARRNAFEVISPDYSHTPDPRIRVRQLIELAPSARRLVLVGSSMGGYVSAQACARLSPAALFLIAPALYFPGWDEEPQGIPKLCSVAHGWNDDVVPVERGIRFAQKHKAELHLLDSGHTLNDQLPMLALLFEDLLRRVVGAASAATGRG
jgi:pimeloyl-ACP methyl ester carboxylesterase